MENSDFQVSSEIFNEKDYSSLTHTNSKNVVSVFKFSFPPLSPQNDSDGDLIVDRKNAGKRYGAIKIEHSPKTKLELVGEQLWRGALLLADWLIVLKNELDNKKYILELGGGTGFTSIVASMFSPVIFTDINKGDIFKLVHSNITRNSSIIKNEIKTVHLDFCSEEIPDNIIQNITNISIIIASDVIYDENITNAFLKTISLLLVRSNNITVYVALEKRYVFTIADLDTVAPCYEHFVQSIKMIPTLKYKELPMNFEQFFEYNRTKDLVLCQINYNSS